MESFTDTAKSSVHIQKSSDKSVFPISQPNIHNSVSSRKSSIRTEIPLKFNKTRPTHKSYKVSSKVHLINANRVLGKDVLKLRCITTCNLTHKATTIPHVKLSIRNSFNNQSTTVSPNVIWSLRLNYHKQPSPANIRKPSCNVTKLSHLKLSTSKLHHDRAVDAKNVSANHLRYKSNYWWWKYQKKKYIFLVILMRIFVFTHLCEQGLWFYL